MNCYKCGEEIKEPAGHICQQCLDEEKAVEAYSDQKEKEAIQKSKMSGKTALSPKEAIMALLDDTVLQQFYDGELLEVKYDDSVNNFFHRKKDARHWLLRPSECDFTGLYIRYEKKTRPMDPFEILAWVNSPDSLGWMVGIKEEDEEFWQAWDIPQRFRYDGKERSHVSNYSYRRAKLLPDRSGIDESTIQGFVTEVE